MQSFLDILLATLFEINFRCSKDFIIKTQSSLLKCLNDFGFIINKHSKKISNIIELENYYLDIIKLRNNLNYEIDGKSEEYFQIYDKNNNCFSYEKKIKEELKNNTRRV